MRKEPVNTGSEALEEGRNAPDSGTTKDIRTATSEGPTSLLSSFANVPGREDFPYVRRQHRQVSGIQAIHKDSELHLYFGV